VGRGLLTACRAGSSPEMGCWVCPGLGAAVRCPGQRRNPQRGWGGGGQPPTGISCPAGTSRLPRPQPWSPRMVAHPGGLRPAKLITPSLPLHTLQGWAGGLVFSPHPHPRLGYQQLLLAMATISIALVAVATHPQNGTRWGGKGGPKHTRDPRQQEPTPAPSWASCLRPAKVIAPQSAGAEGLGLGAGGHTEPPGLGEGPRSCGIPPGSPSACRMTQGGLGGFVGAGTWQPRARPGPCRRHGGVGGMGPARAERHQDHNPRCVQRPSTAAAPELHPPTCPAPRSGVEGRGLAGGAGVGGHTAGQSFCLRSPCLPPGSPTTGGRGGCVVFRDPGW